MTISTRYEVSLNLEGGKVLNCNLLIIAIGANACGKLS